MCKFSLFIMFFVATIFSIDAQVTLFKMAPPEKKIPKPAHFVILGESKGSEDDGRLSYMRIFNLIDTDGDESDYELIEYIEYSRFNDIIGSDFSVFQRMIIRAVDFQENYVKVYGLSLNPDDLEDYAPGEAINYWTFSGDKWYDIFKGILTLPENRAIWDTTNHRYRDFHQTELNDYKLRLTKPC